MIILYKATKGKSISNDIFIELPSYKSSYNKKNSRRRLLQSFPFSYSFLIIQNW